MASELPQIDVYFSDLENLKCELDHCKNEIQLFFNILREQINTRENQLTKQLDDYYNDMKEKVENRSKAYNFIRDTKIIIDNSISDKNYLVEVSNPLMEAFAKVESNIGAHPLDLHKFEIRRKMEFDCVDDLCTIFRKSRLFPKPKWSNLSCGKGAEDFSAAQSMSMERESNTIYIADTENDRIQIYNEDGYFLQTLIHQQLIEPFYVCAQPKYLFVTSPKTSSLLKFDRIYLKLLDFYTSQNTRIGALDVDAKDFHNHIYVCSVKNCTLLVFNENLNKIQTLDFKGHLEEGKDISEVNIQDCKLYNEDIFVLFSDNTSASFLCVFDKTNVIYKKTILERGTVEMGYRFCLGTTELYKKHCSGIRMQIIISSLLTDQIRIFSQSGELLHSIGSTGSELGQFQDPFAICLNQKGEILVCDSKSNFALQAF